MTEHAAVIFVFFFLAEYSSILLMCILTSVLFFGGYLLDLSFFSYIFISLFGYIDVILRTNLVNIIESFNFYNQLLNEVHYSIVLGIKSSFMVFIFIWVRASFPRIRFDQLMSFCWTVLLPILFAFIIFIPSLLYMFGVIFINISLF